MFMDIIRKITCSTENRLRVRINNCKISGWYGIKYKPTPTNYV